jgi:hypothetical protein
MSVTKVPMRGVNTAVDTAAGDDANIGWTAGEGLILTGQGSTNDVTIKNDADADVIKIATGATNVDIVGDVTAATLNADGDTSAGDNAAIGYTAGEGLILTGQGSTDDITVKNDADTTVLNVATGSTDIEISAGDLLFGTAGKGVCLGVTTNTDSNTLDDYEEGYMTATLSGATSGNFVMNGSYDTLAYRKIGDLVHLQGMLQTSSDSSTSGQLEMNLPFTTASLTDAADNHKFMIHMDNHGDGGIENPYLTLTAGENVVWFGNVTDAGTSEALDHSRLDTAFRINIQLLYIAA